jgi:hypothetical protein
MYCGHIEVEAVRDWGVKIGSSVQFGVIHVYGCGYSEAFEGGGAALFIVGQQNLGGPVYLENSTIGLHDAGQHTTVNGITSHTCESHNMLIAGDSGKYFGLDLRRSPINVRFTGSSNLLVGGRIEMAESGKGLEYMSDPRFPGQNYTNNVRDIVITGYGDKDGIDSNSDGNPVDPGEEFAENAIGIDVNTELRRVNITGVTIGACTKGIDFSGGGGIANDGSVIWLYIDSDVDPAVTWPDGQTWSPEPNINETRDIRINGVRWYQQDI